MQKAQDRWDLVAINMSFVMGPPLGAADSSESMNVLKMYGDGQTRFGAPKMGVGVVDVRDVAETHYQAGINPKAHGRYITSGHNTDFLEMGTVLLEKYGKSHPLPKKAMPKWLVMLVGPLLNKTMTRQFIRNNINIEWKADNSKVRKELGIEFMPLQKTMEDGFQALIDAKII